MPAPPTEVVVRVAIAAFALSDVDWRAHIDAQLENARAQLNAERATIVVERDNIRANVTRPTPPPPPIP